MLQRKVANVLNPTLKKVPVDKAQMDKFLACLDIYLKTLENPESEEHFKAPLRDLLNDVYYKDRYAMNTKGRADLVIFNGKIDTTTAGVLFETKAPGSADMVTEKTLDKKSMHELMLYYMRERVDHNNNELKHLIISDFHHWFVFDAADFYSLIYQNTAFRKQYNDWNKGQTDSEKTNSFYKDIASPFIKQIQSELAYAYFDIRQFAKASEDKQVNLYKLLSPEHLLKQSFANDSNTLNRAFYNELLHIIGLEEEGKGKKIINRKAEGQRNPGSMLENAIHAIERDVTLTKVDNLYSYGITNEEQRYSIALELCITWINRILFLKLLEAQLFSYHDKDESFKFLNSGRIPDWDQLNKLFFDVLAVKPEKRHSSVADYDKVPYLNSSLFERTELEDQTILISQLDNTTLPYRPGTVLDKNKEDPDTLAYLFRFLDAYDFSSEGKKKVIKEKKSLINASVLGLIFEKINGYKDGSFFTPGFITMYMCRETIRRVVVQKFNEANGWSCETFTDLKNKDFSLKEANDLINSIRIIDPAVGSGHFLVSALNELIVIKHDLGVLIDAAGVRLKYNISVQNDELHVEYDDGELFEYKVGNKESQRVQETLFHEKQTLIENCLFGVDINPNSVKICRLRLWIELLKHAYYGTSSPPSQGGVVADRGGSDQIMNRPELKSFRKHLRSNLTPAEAALWKMLQKSQLQGRKFRRQHSVGPYILDFYCPSEKLAVELDGDGHMHLSQMEYDMERDAFIHQFGIKVIRIENHWVFDQPEAVLEEISNEFGWSDKATTPPSAPQLDKSSKTTPPSAPLLDKEGNVRQLETLPNIDINIKTGNSLISRFALDEDLSEVFKKQQFSIATYRNAVTAYKDTNDKEAKAELQAFIRKIKEQFRSSVLNRDPLVKKISETRGKIMLLEGNLDLFGAQMSEKAKAAELKKLKKKLQQQEKEREDQLNDTIYQNAFEWRFEFPEVLDDQGNFVGFDVCIGNPPYIRQEELGEIKKYLKENFEVFAGTADLLVYFFELGIQVLKQEGAFCMITSNKFTKANYGKNLRKYLREREMNEIIDFGELPVFDAAATFPAIYRITKSEHKQSTLFTQVNSLEFDELQSVVQTSSIELSNDSFGADFWSLSNPENNAILSKMKSKGEPLGEFVDNKFYRGILTGFNEAFIIDEPRKNELIAKDPKSAEIIFPFAVGDDVRFYHIRDKKRFIILSKIGIEIQKYPAIFKHLSKYQKKLEARWDKGNHWWELRACAYYEAFEKPKIVYPDIAKESRFSYSEDTHYFVNTCYFIPSNDLTLLGILNAKTTWFYYSQISSVLGNAKQGGRLRWFTQDVSKIPIATPSDTQRKAIEPLVTTILAAKKTGSQADTSKEEAQIDRLVYELYGLTEEEIEIIENSVK